MIIIRQKLFHSSPKKFDRGIDNTAEDVANPNIDKIIQNAKKL